MIPNATDRHVDSNLNGDKVAMSFDEHSLAHIMSILTDLYSDPELAVIREYSTNALDSHREAGNSDPIRVTLPTALSPFLKIQDNGVGLSVEDIHTIYSKYGASTKRGTNEATGMLGVGCKAALAYSAQFTLSAVKEGVKTIVAISRDEDGAGSMTIVDTSSTTDRNGVEVSIPAKRGNQLERKANEFFKFWEPGTVLVNGKPPKQFEGLQVTPEITVVKPDFYQRVQNYVVMGNVPYPVEGVWDNSDYPLIVKMPIGSMDFAPSREALQYTKRTKAQLESVLKTFKRELIGALQRSIDTADTKPEALEKYMFALDFSAARNFSFTWRGQKIPTTIDIPENHQAYITNNSMYKLSAALPTRKISKLSAASPTRKISAHHLERSVFVTDYTPAKFTPTHKKKMQQWLSRQQFKPAYFVVIDYMPDLSWVAPDRVVSWDEITAEVLPRKATFQSSNARLAGSYDLVTVDKNRELKAKIEVPASDIDFNQSVYYLHGNYNYDGMRIGRLLKKFQTNFLIICLPKNRLAKFCRKNPKIKNVDEILEQEKEKYVAALTEKEKEAISHYSTRYLTISHFNALLDFRSKILDPEVVRWLDLITLDVTDKIKVLHALGVSSNFMKVINLMEKYPLFQSVHAEESVDYMNWKYQRDK